MKCCLPQIPLLKGGACGLLSITLLSACTQIQCGTATPDVKVMRSVSENTGTNARSVEVSPLKLEFILDKAQLASGECANLRLDAINQSSHKLHWSPDWSFDQEGPPPLLPESSPRSALELPPGRTTVIVNIHMCHADLPAVGTYRYRISAASTSNPIRSNWVTLKVLP